MSRRRADGVRAARQDYALITGGAGFVGTNLAHRLAGAGREVLILDDLSRAGACENFAWLTAQHPGRIRLEESSILDARVVEEAVRCASEVYHLAAQVAVTTSLADPVHDFEVNARGTMNLLEALRRLPDPPPLVFTSTNKVYGALNDVPLRADAQRYAPVDPTLAARGVDEARPLDFRSPYGCSKGAADQYVLDYARCFGVPAIVFRMSCIYGPHQHGNEDQGWVAHFILRARAGEPLTIYGDGRQVRDVLYVDDLVNAFELAVRNARSLAGRTFNMGGGPSNTLSLLELLDAMERAQVRRPKLEFSPWRHGDQRWYVSDTSAFAHATGWRQRVSSAAGVEQLCEWYAGATRRRAPLPLAAAAGQ